MARAAVVALALTQAQVWLGAVGTALLLLTIYYTRKATIAAVTAAEAARDSLTLVERPHLFLAPVAADPINYEQFAQFGRSQPSFEFYFHNAGRTPAITKGFVVEIVVGDDLPPQPAFTEKLRIGETVIAADKTDNRQRCAYIPGISPVDGNRLLVGELRIFLIGYVRYADTLGFLHTTGWGIEWLPKEALFSTAGGAAYNYRKSERDPAGVQPPR